MWFRMSTTQTISVRRSVNQSLYTQHQNKSICHAFHKEKGNEVSETRLVKGSTTQSTEIFILASGNSRTPIQQAIDDWSRFTCLRFREGRLSSSPNNYIRFQNGDG